MKGEGGRDGVRRKGTVRELEQWSSYSSSNIPAPSKLRPPSLSSECGHPPNYQCLHNEDGWV